MSYFNLAFKGISWMAALRIFTRGLVIIKTAVLARILVPAQFGVYGVATIVLGLLETLTETGINIFLIQEKKKLNKYVDSAWVISILRGVVISIIIAVLARPISIFFGIYDSVSILYLISVVALVRGFINPACVAFQKSLEFNKQFIYDGSLFLVDTLVAISLAFISRSELALIWGMIAGAVVEVFISHMIFTPRPKFRLAKKIFSEVVNRGRWVTAASIFNYLFENIDDIFVGRLLGSPALGIYQQAFKIASLPASEVGEVFNKVTFPIYVNLADDKKRVRQAFIKTLIVITISVFIFGALVFYYPFQIVRLILGENWLPAVPVLQILAIYGILKAISNSFFSLFLGMKNQEIVALTSFLRAVILFAAVSPMIKIFGLIGAGFAAVISAVIVFPVFIYFAWKTLK